MAYTAKDGKQFGNREMGRHYDKTRKPESEKTSSSKGSNPQSESHADDGPQHEVVSEHGTATHTHIHGPEKTDDGTHHVHSFHEDGHHHVSRGHTVESAHQHSQLMHTGEGAEGMNDEGETEQEEAAEHEASIPGMT